MTLEDELAKESVKLADQAIQALIGGLGADRSVVLEVNNNTSHTLTVVSTNHSHGGFQHPPDAVIPPKSASGFSSQSSGFLTGTEGSVTYTSDDGKFTFNVSWDNPWAGSNSSGASVSNTDGGKYRAMSITGNGNTHAQMRYFLFELPGQPDWRFCNKCFAMFFAAFPSQGQCPAGGGHAAQGFNFVLPHDIPPGTGQPDWRFCNKCFAMFFAAFPSQGQCPAGGGHAAQGFNFVLPHDVPEPGQRDWRFCNKCFEMFFAGFPSQGHCPAGGGHAAQGFNFVLPFHG